MIWETPAIKNQDRNTVILKTHEKETSTNWKLFMRLSFCVQINHRSEFSFGTFPDRNGWMKMKKNEIDTRTVGGRIKYLRKQLGMSQEELGWALKMEGKSAVYGYESNRRGLSGDVLVDLAKILRTTPEYIISGTTSAEEDPYISAAIVLLKELKTDKARKVALEHIRLVAMMEE